MAKIIISKKEEKYNYCNPREIRPTGWLRKQLELQGKELAGNLDKVWPDLSESSWIGGDKEGWENCTPELWILLSPFVWRQSILSDKKENIPLQLRSRFPLN